jgi:hemerythrin
MPTPAPAVAINDVTGGRGLRENEVGQGAKARTPQPIFLKWLDIFETGNAEIDCMHRKLVDDCNNMLTLVADDAPWLMITAQTKRLVVNCIAHFRVEDSILGRMGFPRRDSHVEEHRRIEQELRDLLARMELVDGSLAEHRDLPASLGPSMIDLMIRHDLDYRSHMLHRQGR